MPLKVVGASIQTLTKSQNCCLPLQVVWNKNSMFYGYPHFFFTQILKAHSAWAISFSHKSNFLHQNFCLELIFCGVRRRKPREIMNTMGVKCWSDAAALGQIKKSEGVLNTDGQVVLNKIEDGNLLISTTTKRNLVLLTSCVWVKDTLLINWSVFCCWFGGGVIWYQKLMSGKVLQI